MEKRVCVIIGVGPGNGAAFASRFSKEGYHLALLARSKTFTTELANKLGNAYAYECDVGQSDSVQNTFSQIQQDLGIIDVIVYNAGSGSWGNIEQIKPEDFEASWRVNAYGLMLVSQQVLASMKQQGKGALIIIGATASKRGGIKTAAFAPAKAAQRSLAESMAKYLGPLGIHVALVIIDGVVGLQKTREFMPDKPDDFFVKPNDVAETVFWLTQQAPSTWSFEVEIRPFGEVW
ncbi:MULTISPECIES: SDR family NAD(P)-dependent oxidoreductase [Legionella]|uniref:SDR family NAD(P)-dependent oxidoreductase n=1 Tax=Legionella TaxID=445 RepID=UPI000969B8D4|nr:MULTISPECIES: SDR family NAD(P)-dependent oxidoreductase [Legionella]MBN9226341.1 SDR family NAD(P)-dependent oxidoreductase [Legionella steelei]OJW12080.1 MAG: short-chain dehydrogenase [Legionella sp. 39-23]